MRHWYVHSTSLLVFLCASVLALQGAGCGDDDSSDSRDFGSLDTTDAGGAEGNRDDANARLTDECYNFCDTARVCYEEDAAAAQDCYGECDSIAGDIRRGVGTLPCINAFAAEYACFAELSCVRFIPAFENPRSGQPCWDERVALRAVCD